MSIPGWQTFIRDKAQEQKVKWTRHAVNALGAETVSVGDVEIALQQAEIIELYTPRHRYLPDCLVLGFVSNPPIHCVVAMNKPQDYILVVTVYQLTKKEWHNDWRTRK